jgi:hypothetical protein
MAVDLRAYRAAERRMARDDQRRGLRVHAMVTAAVSALVVVLNVTVATAFPWAVFPVLGMGLGLAFHWWFGVRQGDGEVRRHQDDVEREVRAA